MTDQNKPGQPKDSHPMDRNSTPNQTQKNPQDRQNQGGADKSRHDSSKDTNPSHSKK